MTFFFVFFEVVSTLLTFYYKILAPLIAVYFIVYQLLSIIYSQLPRVVPAVQTGKVRYLKGHNKNSSRISIVISVITLGLFYLMTVVLPDEEQSRLTFIRDIALTSLVLVVMFVLYKIGRAHQPESLIQLIRKIYKKGLNDNELLAEDDVENIVNEKNNREADPFLSLIIKKIEKSELDNILKKYTYFRLNDRSKILLMHLLENGRLRYNDDVESNKKEFRKSDDLKIVFEVNAPSENNVKKEILREFFKEIFDFNFFEEPINEHRINSHMHYTKSDFYRFVNDNFVIKMSDGIERTFARNDLFR